MPRRKSEANRERRDARELERRIKAFRQWLAAEKEAQAFVDEMRARIRKAHGRATARAEKRARLRVRQEFRARMGTDSADWYANFR